MHGWIFMEQRRAGYWLVNFPQCGEKEDIAAIGIKEENLKLIPIMYAKRNEEIREQFEQVDENQKALTDQAVILESEDISDDLI